LTTVMAVTPKDIREARRPLGFTQIQLGAAVGGVRPETISRWERASSRYQLKVRPLHAEIMRQLTQTTELLQELYPDKADRMQFLSLRMSSS
jgi:transcriptional regulator with XRE-family HTH domain